MGYNPGIYRYLHVRSRMALGATDFGDLAMSLSRLSPSLLQFPDEDGGFTWKDGILLRLRDRRDPSEIAAELKPALDDFEGWGIHDAASRYVEGPASGLLERYFADRPPEKYGTVLCLSYCDNTAASTAAMEQIRGLFTGARTICHFRDGAIVMIPEGLPAAVLYQKVGRLCRSFDGFCGVDGGSTSFSDGRPNEDIWGDVDQLQFESLGESVP